MSRPNHNCFFGFLLKSRHHVRCDDVDDDNYYYYYYYLSSCRNLRNGCRCCALLYSSSFVEWNRQQKVKEKNIYKQIYKSSNAEPLQLSRYLAGTCFRRRPMPTSSRWHRIAPSTANRLMPPPLIAGPNWPKYLKCFFFQRLFHFLSPDYRVYVLQKHEKNVTIQCKLFALVTHCFSYRLKSGIQCLLQSKGTNTAHLKT